MEGAQPPHGEALGLNLISVVEFPNFDGAFIEIIKQSRIDPHFAEVLAKRPPVSSAAADRAVVNADHSVAPDIGFRLAGNMDMFRREVSHTPCEPPTK